LQRSLRAKIIAWSLVPTAIILITVALVNLYSYQQVTEDLVIERDRDLTRLAAKLLGSELATYKDPFAEQYTAVFDAFIVFSSNGTVLAAEPRDYEAGRPDWFDDSSLYQLLRSTEPVISDVIVDPQRGGEIVVVLMPIKTRDGQPAGGIAGLFRLDATTDSALYASMKKLQRGESNCVYLVDGHGTVIYHTNPDYIGQDFADLEAVQLVSNGQVGAIRTRDLEGRDIVASFSPVPDTSWGLITEEDWAALAKTSERYRHYLLALLGLGVTLPAVIIAVGARRITQPITDLIGAAQKVARGNFSQRLVTSTNDELEQLARQFNKMAMQLQESYTQLEQKVADRTKELATLNAIAAEASRSLDLEEIMNNALDEVLEAMDMDKGHAFRLEQETQTLILVAHRGLPEKLVRFTARQPLETGAAGLAAREGRPVVRRVLEYADTRLKELVLEAGIQFVISTPLMVKGKTVGVIELGAMTPRVVTPEELSLLTAIGHQIGVAVENAHLYEQAQQLAVIEERNRLARDLHDSVTQALYGVTLCAEAAARHLDAGDATTAAGQLREIQATTHEALREMRLLIFELRPPILKREGLAVALQTRLDAVEGRFGLAVHFVDRGNGRLSPEIEEGLYRVAQEALNNVLKHACASSVTVSLQQQQERVSLEIWDDGIGFEPQVARERGGFGLRGMEERTAKLGGTINIQSRPGEGTKVRVEVGP
jgi:nitrate/nitrite-specific signal transduction histidine kinase